jgi:hypothetical protein
VKFSGRNKCWTVIRPCLFYLLDYGIAALQKPKSERKKFPPLICIANETNFSVDHIGRAYRSAIPRGRLKCSATGNVVLRSPGV